MVNVNARQLYAAHALSGLMSNWEPKEGGNENVPFVEQLKIMSEMAFAAADEMIKAESSRKPDLD